MRNKVAIVLDLLRDALPGRVPEALLSLKKMGVSGVELGQFYGHTAKEMAGFIRDAELKTVALHRSAEDFYDPARLELAIEEALLLQAEGLVFPYVIQENRTEAGYSRLRECLLKAARALNEHGLLLSYHNHEFELLNQVRGTNALDFMLDPSAGEGIYAEFDVYWLAKAGYDPLAFIRKYPGRVLNLHLKDMTADERQTYAELGTGTIDLPPILSWGEQHAVRWYIIEQDICPGNPWDSLRISLDYLKNADLGNGG
ncbi:sugar phosphate isomerase/epimerase family protein [Paenibacillus montanisoli]|nr:sugar phosphate isomerase/epimerase [Paenibacillus montanisoli]